MFRRSLLPIVRPRPSDTPGLLYDDGVEEDGVILSGTPRLPATGETFPVRGGHLDLLKGRLGGDNFANLTNYLPGAGRGYEPLWRVRSLDLLTGEKFPNERELEVISEKAGLDRGGLFLDLGCSAGLYTRNLARALGEAGDVVGIDISPIMLPAPPSPPPASPSWASYGPRPRTGAASSGSSPPAASGSSPPKRCRACWTPQASTPTR